MLSWLDWCDYLGDDVTWERGQGAGVTGAGGGGRGGRGGGMGQGGRG